MAGIHKIADINPTIDNLCVRIRVLRLWTLPSYKNSPLPYSIEMVWLDEDNAICVVLATITHIMDTPDWWYDQCECNTSTYAFTKTFKCSSCGRLPFFITPSKYRIKLGIIDDSDCACFVKGNLSDTPTLLLNLIDKTFLFIVEVQISDNLHFSPSYKVKKMTDNVDLINKFKETHPIQIDVDYTRGLLPISKTFSIIEGEKVEGAKLRPMMNLNCWKMLLHQLSDYPQSRKNRRWKEIPQLARRLRLRKKLENLDAHIDEKILNSNARSLRDYQLMPYPEMSDIRLFQNKLIEKDLAYDTNEL
ncbi:hypothetical protein Ahy_A04g017895 [Arachis hypogaea]|uniref:Replication factor A C-terminal domain-containing protein n=1 Tax=Arachis hypogaea TaxID=3818 RepID=A0A445DCB9_ARAHY|nr:hypothetical protein Ahy_A04g017895 [Arachis hypogaea]